MKIAIVSQTFDTRTNGQGVFAVHLAEGLAARGHDVLALRPAPRMVNRSGRMGSVRVVEVAGLPIVRRPRPTSVPLRAGPYVGQVLDRYAPDVVHLQDHYPLARSALGQARQRGIPVVATNHFVPRNMLAFVPLPPVTRKAIDGALWAWLRGVFNRVALSTAPSPEAVQLLVEQGVTTTTDAISCGVDVARFRSRPGFDRAAVRARHGLHADGPLAIYVGRLDPDKRVDLLIAGLARTRETRLQLAIVGRGRETARLRRLTRHHGLEGRVRLTGFLAGTDLVDVMRAADVFAMPGDAELQSIATLEALAVGLPVLVADALALPGLVRDGVNGRLFRPGDAGDLARGLDRLLAERDRWPAMSARARRVALEHDLVETVRRYEALYARVVGRGRQGGEGSAAALAAGRSAGSGPRLRLACPAFRPHRAR